MLRTQLYANPHGRFVHELILESCRQFPQKTALLDASCNRRISYAEYGDIVETLARAFIAAGLKPGEVIAIFLPNSWEFCAAYHAATLAGALPTLLNPSYREREVRYQLENSGATMLITDSPLVKDMNLAGLPLRAIYTTRQLSPGTREFAELLKPSSASLPMPDHPSDQMLAALPYSSGTTGLPKGVMLSHYNLVANVYQLLGPGTCCFHPDDVVLCFLPLYHIYGLNVVLNPLLALGATVVLVPRFNLPPITSLLIDERVTMMPTVPPALNAFCQAAEEGLFPRDHHVRWVKSGAAPLSPELARRFTSLTGIRVLQGYGMTEASPVTHCGFLRPDLYRPESIGWSLAQTECRIVDSNDLVSPIANANEAVASETEAAPGEPGELVMRGPQIMLGYWKETQATAAVLRDGWYWSGDIVTRDQDNFYYVLDRRKEMIKYKGFPVAPAEIEAVLLEHSAVADCGVVGRPDSAAGEVPVAFVVLRQAQIANQKLGAELCDFVAQRLTQYKQPREVRFVEAIPKTPSGKILRRELRKSFA